MNELVSANPSQLSEDSIHDLLQKRMLTPCNDIKPFGGGYIDFCKISDGHKYICVDKLLEDVEKQRVCLPKPMGIAFKIVYVIKIYYQISSV